MKTLAVLTSGGDAPGMNAGIRAVVRAALFYGCKIYGVKNGYAGLLKGQLELMEKSSVADIIQRGGTILGTARSDDFPTEEGINKALNVLDVYGVDGLICIGGDGTFRGAKLLADRGFPIITIPCTIDNDLGFTDYTIGFWTAVETVLEAIGKIRDTSSSHGRASIIEVMGRDCGDLALYSALAGGAESVLVPEHPTDINAVLQKALEGRSRGKRQNLIIIAEGSGDPYEVQKAMQEKTGIETRVTVLGYVQRGGTPVAIDRVMASSMGKKAVELLLDEQYNLALGVSNNQIFSMDLTDATQAKKIFREELYKAVNALSI